MPRNRLDFQFDSGAAVKTVKHVVPIDVYLAAQIVDGEGKSSNRIVVRAKGDKQFYFLFQKGAEESMRRPAEWLQMELEQIVDGPRGAVLPDDSIEIQTGDPLEA